MRRLSQSFADVCHRMVATGAAILVLLLALLTVSPELHEGLHAAEDSHHEDTHSCGVVLFAGGVSLAIDTAAVSAPGALAWHEQPRVVAAEVFLASPRYLRQPERGPPVS